MIAPLGRAVMATAVGAFKVLVLAELLAAGTAAGWDHAICAVNATVANKVLNGFAII
jgi:hypothetical protein